MLNPVWIWQENKSISDSYVRFKKNFTAEKGNYFIDISCDTFYNIYINSVLVSVGWFFDYEYYKMKDKIEITDFIKKGENTLEIVVWYAGVPSHNYSVGKAGLYFSIYSDKGIVAVSDKSVLCTTENSYISHSNKYINKCLGLSFTFDNNIAHDYRFKNCTEIDKKVVFANSDKNLKNLVLKEKRFGTVKKNRKNHYLIDFNKEYYGFISFSLFSAKPNNVIKVFFGEYLKNDSVTDKYDGDNSSYFTFIARQGANTYENLFRAFGCRYLEFVCEDVDDISCAIIPVVYPFTVKPYSFETELQKEIYEKCLRTLKCCTAKHYMDCPCREQAMYILDSRNQMLIGYSAFEGFELQRFNLLFLSKGLNKDGLIPPSPPGANTRIIPFFNLIYIIQVYEYYENTHDIITVQELEKTMDAIVNVFFGKISAEEGLIPHFKRPSWNFYEWTDGNDNWIKDLNGSDAVREKTFDVNVNCAFVIALEKYKYLKSLLGKVFDYDLSGIRKNIKNVFYNADKNAFRNYKDEDSYSKLGNSLAILAEVLTSAENKKLAKKMIDGNGFTDVSLSMLSFYYDALLKVDLNYKSTVLQDIYDKYSIMLNKGATTFWETLGGADDFGGSASLCHGWSALPIYYFNKLGVNK